MKQILQYLRGTLDFGLLRRSLTTDLVVYIDVNWVGCPDMRHSTSGYVVFLCDSLVPYYLLVLEAVVGRLPLQRQGRELCRG